MWKTVRLGNVCDLQNGFAFKSSLFREEGLPILRISNIQNEEVSLEGLAYFVEEDYDISFERYKVLPNDLLIAMSGATTGKLGFNQSGKTLYLNQRVGKFEPKEELDKKFLYYVLSTKVEENLNVSKGAAQPNLSTKQIKDIEIPLPPLAEQQRIVAKLDAAFAEIDGTIALADEQIKDNHQLFVSAVESRFKNREDWEKKTLQDVCEKITDGTHQTPKYVNDGYIFLSSKNVTTRKIDWINIKYIDEEQHVAMQRRLSPRKGDILLAKNGTTGVAAMVDRDIEFDIYVSLAWLRSKGEVTPQYLLQFINSNAAKAQFSKRLKGVGVPNLHLKEIREVEICFPASISMQNEVSTLIEKIDSLYQHRHSLLRKKKENLNGLKSALLKKELQPSEAA